MADGEVSVSVRCPGCGRHLCRTNGCEDGIVEIKCSLCKSIVAAKGRSVELVEPGSKLYRYATDLTSTRN